MNKKILFLMMSAMLVLAACSMSGNGTVNVPNNSGTNTEGENNNDSGSNNGSEDQPNIAEENPNQANAGDEMVMCTMEAKMCPDGSFVGRSGPKCEFAACPGEVSGGLTIKEVPQLGRIISPEAVFNAYIEENIGKVSKKQPTLGGNWVISSIDNNGEGTAIVDYEDGHVTGKMQVKYEIVDDKAVIKEVLELEE